MSAYQVEPATIDLIVSAAIEWELHARLGDRWQKVTRDNAQAFGLMLWRANARSVAFRYQESETGDNGYRFREYSDVTPAAAFGCIRCFDYQACEPGDYRASDAFAFVHAMYAALAKRLIGRDGKESPWGIDDPAEIAAKGFARPMWQPGRTAAPAPGETVRLSDLARRAAPPRGVNGNAARLMAAIAAETAPAAAPAPPPARPLINPLGAEIAAGAARARAADRRRSADVIPLRAAAPTPAKVRETAPKGAKAAPRRRPAPVFKMTRD